MYYHLVGIIFELRYFPKTATPGIVIVPDFLSGFMLLVENPNAPVKNDVMFYYHVRQDIIAKWRTKTSERELYLQIKYRKEKTLS